MRHLLFVLILSFAIPAGAADWLLFGDSSRVVTALRSGQWASYTPVDATDDSLVLDMGGCENSDLLYFNDTDGNGTAGTVTVTPRQCPQGVTASADACWAIEGVTMTGTAPNEAIYGVKATTIWLEAGGAENDGDTQQFEAWCNTKADK